MKWKVFVVAVVVVAVLVVGFGRRRSVHSAGGFPQRVPPEGLVMSELNGAQTNIPIAFYPSGTIYGIRPMNVKSGQAAMALEGTYDDPGAVAGYYQRFYQDTTKAQRFKVFGSMESTAMGTTWGAGANNSSAQVTINVWTDVKGFSRDIARWDPGSSTHNQGFIGGDPKETMIWLLIRWK